MHGGNVDQRSGRRAAACRRSGARRRQNGLIQIGYDVGRRGVRPGESGTNDEQHGPYMAVHSGAPFVRAVENGTLRLRRREFEVKPVMPTKRTTKRLEVEDLAD